MICFIHIHKNGGTTFRRILRNNFGPNAIQIDYGPPNFEFTSEQYHAIFKMRKSIKTISSHNIRYPFSFPNKQSKAVLFLREPFSRMMSQYYYLQQITAEGHYSHQNFDTFYSCLRDKRDVRFINGQTFHIAKNFDVEKAKDILHACFAVGCCEMFDQSLLCLKSKMGDPKFDIRYERTNITKKKSSKKDYIDAIKETPIYEMFRNDNEADYALYMMAINMLEKDIEQYGKTFETELEELRKANVDYRFPFIPMKRASFENKIRNRLFFHKYRNLFRG